MRRSLTKMIPVAARWIARGDRAAGNPAPEPRAVLAPQPLLARVGAAAIELGVGEHAAVELFVGEIHLAPRSADRLARAETEHFLEAPVAAHDLALAADGDAD